MLTSSVSDGKISVGGRIVITPNVEGGAWNWDETFFTATFNSPATFTALKAGTSVITYTVDGVSATYTVTVADSVIPSTGQNFSSFGFLILLGALGLSAAMVLRKRKGHRA